MNKYYELNKSNLLLNLCVRVTMIVAFKKNVESGDCPLHYEGGASATGR